MTCNSGFRLHSPALPVYRSQTSQAVQCAGNAAPSAATLTATHALPSPKLLTAYSTICFVNTPGLGVTRVVVGRELSIREISQLSSNTTVDVEAFCHGALCVSYSGQCYSSEAWGGRSANRGQCAQACRMPYGLIVDGQLKDLQDISYLLSPQDLMALDHVGDMVAAGVGCFKIEGRLKGPEYVAATTAAYKTGG